MNLLRTATVGVAALLAVGIAGASRVQAAELITNGGFETGDFTGWSANAQGGSSGNLIVSNTTSSGLGTVGAASGTFYAVTQQGGPGSYSLEQDFTVAPNSTATLSFDLFANNYAGSVLTPNSLDFTAGANQQVRVDLLDAGQDPFSTDVLQTFYDGADSGSNPNPYTHYSFDISNLIANGGPFTLRFSETDNQLFLNMGVDNVSIQTNSAVPEPGQTAVLAIGVLGLAGLAFRARRRTVA